jgi:hypothetical protein
MKFFILFLLVYFLIGEVRFKGSKISIFHLQKPLNYVRVLVCVF